VAKPLVNWYGGEPWFDNPHLVIANKPKRKRRSTMARTNRRRRGRRRARRNYYSAGALMNRPRRRRRSHRRRRSDAARRVRHNVYMPLNRKRRRRGHRRARSNPQMFGLQLPPLDAVLWVGAGAVLPPIVTNYALRYVPETWKTNQAAMWLVKAASVLVPSMIVRRFVSRRAGNLMLIGGATYFVLDFVKTTWPGLIPGLGYQPMLGAYHTGVSAGRVSRFPQRTTGLPPMIQSAPERLNPANRF
jgi:hypothetical protein